MRHAHIHVTGIVQGVGMRPFVYREAMAHGICGWVLNAGDGVHIEAHAQSESLDKFIAALSEHAPAASRVEHVEVVDLAPGDWDAANEQGFRIVASQDQTSSRPISPRATTACASCSTPPTDAFIIPLSTAPIADRALPSFARCPMTERPPRWIAFPCAPPAPQSMPTRSIGGFTRSPMPALIADRILRGARRIATLRQRVSAQHQLSAPRARPAMPSSNAASSCWLAAASSPSRVSVGST